MTDQDNDKNFFHPDRNFAWLLLVWIGVFSVYALLGLQSVPFHPDESTYLFMSSDYEALLSHPMTLAWDPAQSDDPQQLYRGRDAPLTRYILGAGRSLARLPAHLVDWDWGKTWEENRAAGAMPDPHLLTVGRATITLLLPFSLLFIYLIGTQVAGPLTGILAALLLGSNALVLLHNRRAMTEGVLTFGILFALWSFLQADKRPWLAGLAMAIAFNAKQSSLALLPVGFLAVCWMPANQPTPPPNPPSIDSAGSRKSWTDPKRLKKIAWAGAQYLIAFMLLTALLNPYLWRDPIPALQASLVNRKELLDQQVNEISRLAPEQILHTPPKRAAVLLANLFLVPPSFYEVGNYREQTAAAEVAYLATPGHNLFRNILGAGVFLTLTLFGIVLAAIQVRHASPSQRRRLILLLAATLLQGFALIYFIPLPWQRYAMPMASFVSLWSAFAIGIPLSRVSKPNT